MIYATSIKNYICDELAPDIDPEKLPDDFDLLSSGIIDSLSLVRLVVWIEEEYGIPMGDIEITPEDFRSVEKVSAFIARHSMSTIDWIMSTNGEVEF